MHVVVDTNDMRINRYIAASTGMSRRAADTAIAEGRVRVNAAVASTGQEVSDTDVVELDGQPLTPATITTIVLNKPAGYVTSRNGQGSHTIYDLLPETLHHLKPIGRLDKDSSGLLLLTNDGALAQTLTHPRHRKVKVYNVTLNAPLQPLHRQMITDVGLQLDDGLSRLQLDRLHDNDDHSWRVTMHEGRNRQIRRTFAALGYEVRTLHRIQFGQWRLDELKPGHWQTIEQ